MKWIEYIQQHFKYFFYGVIFVIVLILLLYARKGGIREGLSRCEDPVPEGYTIISRAAMDSLISLANAKPDTVVITKWVKGDPVEKIVYVDSSDQEYQPPYYTFHKDLVDEGIDAWITTKSIGPLEILQWGYTPLYRHTIETISVPRPYPVTSIVKEKVPQRGLYGVLGVGAGHGPKLGISMEMMIQQRNGLMYGGQVVALQDNMYYLAKVGFKIF